MFRTKKDVDRHVQEILRKLKTENERNLRCYHIAKLYYQVGDYESAKRYVSSYLEVREDAAGAHKLLGQTLEALDQKEAALLEYKCSLELEGRQDDLVLKVCELLADTDVGMDVSRARYWVERADRQFPHHPVVFQLKEKLLTVDRPNDNVEDLESLIAAELSARPMDVTLRVKLLRHYMDKNKLEEAYKHAISVEATHAFRDNITWYEAVCEMLAKCKDSKRSEWSFWVLYVSALERFAALSLKEQGDGPKKTVPEAAQAVLNFDQSLTEAESHKTAAGDSTFADHMFGHMWGQLHLHLACLLLRKTKREQGSWTEAGRLCSPLLLCALHTAPPDPAALWVTRLKDQQRNQVNLWCREGSYRCSQAGHVLQDYTRGDTKKFLDKIDKFCTGAWRERVYQRTFQSRVQQQLIKSSYFANHPASSPSLRLCTHSELKHHDEVSEEVWPASLHHQVWLGIKSRPHHNQQNTYSSPHPHQYSHIFPELQFSVYNLNQAGADSLSRLDVDAFLNAAVLCASVVVEEQQRSGFVNPDRLPTLPADITNTLCSSAQEKWWIAAYKMYHEQEGVGSEIGEIRQILQRGLEVIRCIDNHGLHPCLLVHLARIFHHRAKILKEKNEKHSDIPALENRCELYWSAAVPLLERLQNNQAIRSTGTKLFDYQGKEMNNVELTNALDEGRLLLAQRYLRDKQHEQAIEALQALKCPEASFQQGQIYKTLADELVSSLPRESLTSEMRSQHIIMLSKARDCFYLTLDRLRSPGTNPKHPLNAELCTHISGIENELKRIDPDLWRNDLNRNECDELSDETYSSAHSGDHPIINTSDMGMSSSANKMNTPQKSTHRLPQQSSTPYRQWFPQHQEQNLDLSRLRNEARPSPERLDAQIRQLIHSRDNVIQTIMDQNKALLESNKSIVERIEELKKEMDDLRREIQKQSNQPTINPNLEEDLYVLGDEDYGDLNYGATAPSQPTPASSFPANIFSSAQRHPAYPTLVYPSGTLQGYYQPGLSFGDQTAHIPTLYPPNVYPMPALYSQPPPVDPNLGPLPKISENLLQQGLLAGRLPNQVPEPGLPPEQPIPVQGQKLETPKIDIPAKETPSYRAPPVNVVITTSDTLPTTTPAVQPALSVTIPAHHRLGGNPPAVNVPHNYQIPMPLQATIPTTVNLPPLSTTLTNTILSNMSISENYGGNTSVLPSSTANDSSEWTPEVEHDPIPDFVPVIPLPAEVEITTGEEDEITLYSGRAKLFRFVDKEWKERGVGQVKLLKNDEGKVRLLMRRDQVLKICANHLLRSDMELNKMANNDKAYIWIANDFADEEVKLEKLCIKFKTEDEAVNFKVNFDKAKKSLPKSPQTTDKAVSKTEAKLAVKPAQATPTKAPVVVGGFSFTGKPIIQQQKTADITTPIQKTNDAPKPSPFAAFFFNKSDATAKEPQPSNTNPNLTGGISFEEKPTETKSTGFSFVKPASTDATPVPFSFGSPSLPNLGVATTLTQTKHTPTQNASSVISLLKTSEEPKSPLSGNTPKKLEEKSDNNNTSRDADDPVEEFVPTAEFAPVIPLPDTVDIVTGEEGEDVLFEERAKLLRFDTDSKQWKERGIGQMKILIEPKSGKVRLLMRREQVLKVCCNHTLLAEITFNFRTDNNKAISWCAQDYSEGEVKPEMFTIRFKTTDQASEFHKVITTQQRKMIGDRISDDAAKAPATSQTKPEANVKDQTKSLVEMFKPASGSWECQGCYTRNDGSQPKCIACQSPGPASAKPTSAPPATFAPNKVISISNETPLSELCKPTSGSWECKSCYVMNDGSQPKCIACESPGPASAKPTSAPPATFAPNKVINISNETPLSELCKPTSGSWECKSCYVINKAVEYNCIACNAPNTSAPATTVPADKPPLAQLFKPNAGSWECKGCYVMNSGSNTYCVACDAPQDPSMPPKPKSIGFNIATSSTPASSFTFGIPQGSAKDAGSGGFTFGAPQTASKAGGGDSGNLSSGLSFGSQKINETSTFTFGTSPGLQISQSQDKPFTFGSPGKSFDFHFPTKCPVKSPGGGETSEDEVAESEDVYFAPVIPLPDRIDVKTGEENEEVLYSHRAKLFRYEAAGKEWKERGLGDIKLLRHKETGKLRLLMRRDQVFKLCLNHIIPRDMEFSAKDDKTWFWYAADYSEGDIVHEQFACRFKSSEIAREFKNAIDKAQQTASPSPVQPATKTIDKSPLSIKKNLFGSSSDIEVIYKLEVTPEEKVEALKLKLPENFYAYKKLPDCPGCRGCKDSDTSLFDSPATTRSSTIVTDSRNSFAAKPIFSPPKLTVPNSTSGLTNLGEVKANLPNLAISTSGKTLFADSSTGISLNFGAKPAANIFGNVSSSTNPPNTVPTVFSGFASKPAAPLAQGTKNTIFGGSPSTMVSSTGATSLFGGNISGGFSFDSKSLQSNAALPSTNPPLGGNITATPVFSFGGTTSQPPASDEDKILDNSKICTPASFNPSVAPPNANIFAGSGASLSGNNAMTPSIFGGNSAKSIFAAPSFFGNNANPSSRPFTNTIFETSKAPSWPNFGTGTANPTANNAKTEAPEQFVFGGNTAPATIFGSVNKDSSVPSFGQTPLAVDTAKSDITPFLPTDNTTTFSTLAAAAPEKPAFQTDPNFSFAGAGSSVFGAKPTSNVNLTRNAQSKKQDLQTKKKDEDEDEDEEADNGEEHDPHFEPIIPLPDAIEVRTGEEDEEKVFCQRAKLYRYVNALKEWKERGVGEMKLLHHANNGTYRLLLRREQVHKVVCNLLLTPDLEFRTLNSSDRAWCWAGMNYAEEEPALEELAIKFKNTELAAQFKDAIDRAQQALREKQNISQVNNDRLATEVEQDDEEDEEGDEDETCDEEVEEEDENDEYCVMFEKKATLAARTIEDSSWKPVGTGYIRVLYDPEIFGARIVLETEDGEILSNTAISIQTSMLMNGTECMWSAKDFALEVPVSRNLKAIFSTIPEAQEMYMSFEEGQGFARESEIIESDIWVPAQEE